MMLWPRGRLWRHRDFLKLWAAQIVSAFGSRITRTALPVIAVLSLSASPVELAWLAVLTSAPGVVVGLAAGGWIDRCEKRPIMIGADLARAAAVATLPLAAMFGVVRVAQTYCVAAIVGAATALFVMADGAYLPVLLESDQVFEGNSKQQATESVAEILGPAGAGVLIQLLGAPLAVAIDALSYVWSAAFVAAIRPREEPPVAAAPRLRVVADALTGLKITFGHPLLRSLSLAFGAVCFSGGFFAALYMLYALSDLQLSTAVIGAVISAGGVGALIGVAAARWLPRVLGLGRTLVVALVAFASATLLIPLAGSAWVPRSATVPLLVLHQLAGDGGLMVFSIHAVTIRQTVLPVEVLGRVNGSLQVLFGSLVPLGAVVAGPLAELFSVRTALCIGLGFGSLAPLSVLLSPVASLRRVDAPGSSIETAR